jgi:hypothetical protein
MWMGVSRLCGAVRAPREAVPRLPFLLVLALLFPSVALPQVVLNEILYDPEGSDTGLEFVEVANCGRVGVSLSGWTLETGNGANPDDWTVEWIGGAFDYLEPGEILLVGESSVDPVPDYVTALDLQNGPDGVRLTDGSSVVDVVGWGEPLFHEYYEGDPAADVPSGSSLARSPDCYDHDNNALDLRADPAPTPGAWNSHDVDVGVDAVHAGAVVFDGAEPVRLACVVRNDGSLTIEAGGVSLSVFLDDGPESAATVKVGARLSPRDSVEVSVPVYAPPGYHTAVIRVSLPGDGCVANDASPTSFTIGSPGGLLKINEIMFSPPDGGTEWVELVSAAGAEVDPTGWLLGDGDDMHAVVIAPDGDSGFVAPLVPPGGYLVVAKSPAALAQQACPVARTDGWEALSASDRVVLRDSFGTPIDDVTYDDAWGGGRGVSLERVRADIAASEPCNWGGSVDPSGGTPCGQNSIHLPASPAGGRIGVTPNPFTPNGDGDGDRVAVSYELPLARATVRITVYDVLGRARARLVDLEPSASRGELLWDGVDDNGAPLPTGLYVVRLEAIDAREGVLVDEREALGLVR